MYIKKITDAEMNNTSNRWWVEGVSSSVWIDSFMDKSKGY